MAGFPAIDRQVTVVSLARTHRRTKRNIIAIQPELNPGKQGEQFAYNKICLID